MRRPAERLTAVTAAARSREWVTAFDIELDRPGSFPPRRPESSTGEWAPATSLLTLGERVRGELRRREIAFDAKPFRAHVTLGRVREDASLVDARSVAAAVEAMRVPHLRFPADAVVVFESVLSPRGPKYTARGVATLRVGKAV